MRTKETRMRNTRTYKLINDILIACGFFALIVCITAMALGIWYSSINHILNDIGEKAMQRSYEAERLGEYLKEKGFSRTKLIESLCSAPERVAETLDDERYTVSADLLTEDDVIRTVAAVELEDPDWQNDPEYVQLLEALNKTKSEVEELRARYNNSGNSYNTFRLFMPEIKTFDCGCE